MTEIKTFYPEKPGEFPLVIGLPGFVSTLEGGRTRDILSELPNHGIAGYGITYSGIKEKNGLITCNVSQKSFRRDLVKLIDEAIEDSRIDHSRISFFVSSISGGVLGDYLANSSNPIKPLSIVSISPLLGGPYFLPEQTEEEREQMKNLPYVNISSPADKEQGIERRIPRNAFKEIAEIDALRDLRENYHGPPIKMLTIVGRKDKVADPVSIREYHKIIGGEDKYLVEIDCGHAIPSQEIGSMIIRFFEENASRKAA